MELEKLDRIDKNVLVWVSRNMPGFLPNVIVMYKNDYQQKRGLKLDTSLILTEIRKLNNK